MGFLTAKKLLILGFVFILLVAIPLTVYFVQQQQQTKTQAAPATKLFFSPLTQTKNVNDDVTLDISIDPGANQVSFVKLDLSYDATKLATNSAGTTCNQALCPTDDFPVILEGPIYAPGTVSITLSIGPNPTKVIQAVKKVVTLKFKAVSTTTSDGTAITFGPQTQVLSLASTDQVGENVLLPNSTPAKVIINQGTSTTTPTPATTQAPVCASLSVDRATTGNAPYPLTFTATGSDPVGTVSKVTFDFGDGPVQDVTQAGGIGTKSVSVPIAHTYNNSGTFKASAVLTNNLGGTSTPGVCIQNITVLQASGSATLTPTVTTTPAIVTATPVQIPTQIPITSPGPGNTLVGVGIVGIVLSLVGGILFFAL